MLRRRGFSLFESMLAVAIAGVLAGLAVPAFTTLALDSRRTAALNDFVIAIQLARSESVKRGEEVVLCKTGGRQSCTTAGDWQTGWIVFVNLDEDSPPVRDAPEPLVQVHAAVAKSKITANRNSFTFRPFTSASTNGTVTYCDTRGANAARAIIVSASGRPRMSTRNGSGGVLKCPAR
jgi:type IV fimbrial biogenesis protein FimT